MFGLTARDARLAVSLFTMTLRDRYLGSTLGTFWAVANPLMMLALYTFVFGFVFKVRLPGAETTLAYVTWLISGYGPWLGTVEALTAATASVAGAAGIVKNLAIKTELLPIASTFVGGVSILISLVFLIVLLLADNVVPGWSILWLPLIVVAHFALLVALGLWLSALNVFVRDLSLALPNLLTIVLFSTPIFYPLQSQPPALQLVSRANPFFSVIEAYRAVIIYGHAPSPTGLVYVLVFAAVVGAVGLKVFRRVKGQFGSML